LSHFRYGKRIPTPIQAGGRLFLEKLATTLPDSGDAAISISITQTSGSKRISRDNPLLDLGSAPALIYESIG